MTGGEGGGVGGSGDGEHGGDGPAGGVAGGGGLMYPAPVQQTSCAQEPSAPGTVAPTCACRATVTGSIVTSSSSYAASTVSL